MHPTQAHVVETLVWVEVSISMQECLKRRELTYLTIFRGTLSCSTLRAGNLPNILEMGKKLKPR